MPDIRYPPEPEDGMTRVEWERELLNPWRQCEKARLAAERKTTICERCGQRPFIDLDESVIPRCDMGGFSLEQRRIAFGSPNLTLACMRCNREEAHDREGAWDRACERYGRERVVAWYVSLGLKAPRADWMT